MKFILTFALILLAVLSVTFSYFWEQNSFEQEDYLKLQTPQKLDVDLLILSNCQVRGSLIQYSARVFVQNKNQGKVLLKLKSESCPYFQGDRLQAHLKIKTITGFKNPHTFNRKLYWRRQGFTGTAFIKDLTEVKMLKKAGGLLASLAQLKNILLLRIRKNFPEKVSELSAAMLLGIKPSFDSQLYLSFQYLGLTHLMVVSGLHLTLLASVFYWPLYFLLSLNTRLLVLGHAHRGAFLLTLVPAFFYAALIGFQSPVMRAFCMLTVIAVQLFLNWTKRPFVAWALAVFVLLLVNPHWIFMIGFQLSVLATFYFIVPGQYLFRKLNVFFQIEQYFFLKRFVFKLFIMLILLTGLQLFMSPLLIYHFNQISYWSPLANLILAPVILFVFLPLILLNLIFGSNFMLSLLVQLEHFLSFLAECSFLKLGYVEIYFMALLPNFSINLPTDQLKLTVFDVGQGESILIQTPNKKSILIDAGGIAFSPQDIGQQVIAKELRARGIEKIDYLIISHADYDHYGGAFYLLNNFEISEIWWNGRLKENKSYKALFDIIRHKKNRLKKSKLTQVVFKQSIHWTSGSLKVLSRVTKANGNISHNNASVVLQLCHYKTCVLLTGDIESEQELKMARLENIRSQILKVAHHGSKTSSSELFLDAVAPEVVLISLGEENHFRMPHVKTLNALQSREIAIYRTDLQGQINLYINSDGYFIETFIKDRARD